MTGRPQQTIREGSLAAFVTRFAPSPTGRLHRGHGLSALTGWNMARECGGRFLLRIEDIDFIRCRPEFEAGIFEDLAWLGLDWETPVRRQSDHMHDYRTTLDSLAERGLVYRCFRTRREVMEAAASAPHAGENVVRAFIGAPLPAGQEAALLAAGETYAWRLSVDRAKAELAQGWDALGFEERIGCPCGEPGWVAARPELAGDVVLARKDVGVAYHLAVVVDDALQGVTDIVRGQDLFEATHIQVLLQALLDLPRPNYHHHALLLGPDGKRLAKRDRAETLEDLRTRGVTAEEIRSGLGFSPA